MSSIRVSFRNNDEYFIQVNVRRHTNTTVLTESEGLADSERRVRRSIEEYTRNRNEVLFSYDFTNCQCIEILLSAYSQAVEHSLGAEEHQKLFEAYLEYTDLSVINLNIPQAIRLLFDVENLINSEKFCTKCSSQMKWMNDFRLGRILAHRGACLLESGDTNEAKKLLLRALELFYDPFPASKHAKRIRYMQLSFKQFIAFYVAPRLCVPEDRGLSGLFYEYIAWTHVSLYKVFIECNEKTDATLTAKLAMNYALQASPNFRLLCACYGNLIMHFRQEHDFSMCERLEQLSMDVYKRKLTKIDVTEIQAVGYLYTSIFLFHAESGKKIESVELGLSVMRMMSTITELTTRQALVLWILKLLLMETRVNDMISIMREFFYMTDHYDLSSETWYYYYALVILLDTGHCVESYKTCERFYMKKGDAILRSKTSLAAWNFFVCMWLVTIRLGIWEKTIMWEEKIKQLVKMKFDSHEFYAMILVRLIEGLLISMVEEINHRNVKKIQIHSKIVKSLLRHLHVTCKQASTYTSRYYFLLAYFNRIKDKRTIAYNNLAKASELCNRNGNLTLLAWINHTRRHWDGTLNQSIIEYWSEHIDVDHQIDHRDLESDQLFIPYTLPLPKDIAN